MTPSSRLGRITNIPINTDVASVAAIDNFLKTIKMPETPFTPTSTRLSSYSRRATMDDENLIFKGGRLNEALHQGRTHLSKSVLPTI